MNTTATVTTATPGFHFKIADREEEFEAVHRLNHRTFAEEIPQHDRNAEGMLVDRFHRQNHYVIALSGGELAGMVCMRFDRPFSLDQKIPEAMAALPKDRSWCEIRLLALEPGRRGSPLLTGLLRTLIRTVEERGRDAAVISATTRQLKLYRHLGFTPFGPLVGREGAWYQPMWVLLERLRAAVPLLVETKTPAEGVEPVNFTPGPVRTPAYVSAAFNRPSLPHRSAESLRMVREIRDTLTGLTGARHTALMPGGGTMANDVVAAQLRLLPGRGLILDSGEFGRRLTDHARRAGLEFGVLNTPRGGGITAEEIRRLFKAEGSPAWLWLTHCETSTGALHPLAEIAAACQDHGVKLCADCVSSLGVVPVDLRAAWLASAASGKGLAALPGIAIVFHNQPAEPRPERIPRCLDLGLYAAGAGVPFTLGSNITAALHAAVTLTDWPAKIERVRRMGDGLRREMERAGLPLLSRGDVASPAVITLSLPPRVPCVEFAERVEREGRRLAAHSGYLLDRNEVQVCLMGDLRPRHTRGLTALLARTLRSFPEPAP
ncbi:MAG: aminotransferase class V-fold PLP-dependent enzyme [Verrucomicrobiota bacterium]